MNYEWTLLKVSMSKVVAETPWFWKCLKSPEFWKFSKSVDQDLRFSIGKKYFFIENFMYFSKNIFNKLYAHQIWTYNSKNSQSYAGFSIFFSCDRKKHPKCSIQKKHCYMLNNTNYTKISMLQVDLNESRQFSINPLPIKRGLNSRARERLNARRRAQRRAAGAKLTNNKGEPKDWS